MEDALRQRFKVLLLLAALLAAVAPQASAGTIGPLCGTCQGGVYTLEYELLSSGGGIDVIKVILDIDTSAYTGGGAYITDVAPKVSSSVVSATLLSAYGGNGSWTTGLGGLSADGCNGAGSGFFCSQSLGLGAPVVGPSFPWEWQVSLPTGTLFLGDVQASLKVRYADVNGKKVGDLVSENITITPGEPPGQIPEPPTSALLVVGLGFLGLRKARRIRS